MTQHLCIQSHIIKIAYSVWLCTNKIVETHSPRIYHETINNSMCKKSPAVVQPVTLTASVHCAVHCRRPSNVAELSLNFVSVINLPLQINSDCFSQRCWPKLSANDVGRQFRPRHRPHCIGEDGNQNKQ